MTVIASSIKNVIRMKKFDGLSSLENVIASLETRFKYHNHYVNDNHQAEVPTSKHISSKDDKEWVSEGRDFIDDSEIMENEDRDLLEKQEELVYDGFFAYRGPVINCVKRKKKSELKLKKRKLNQKLS